MTPRWMLMSLNLLYSYASKTLLDECLMTPRWMLMSLNLLYSHASKTLLDECLMTLRWMLMSLDLLFHVFLLEVVNIIDTFIKNRLLFNLLLCVSLNSNLSNKLFHPDFLSITIIQVQSLSKHNGRLKHSGYKIYILFRRILLTSLN